MKRPTMQQSARRLARGVMYLLLPPTAVPHPSLFGASLTSNIVRSSSARIRSSLIILTKSAMCGPCMEGGVPRVDTCIFALHLQRGLGRLRVQDEVVVAVRAELVATPQSAVHHSVPVPYIRILKLARVLSKCLLALLAYKRHVERLREGVVGRLSMALCAVEPFFACPYEPSFSPSTSADPQHGERMETWALRTCLLRRISDRRGAGVQAAACLPHGDGWFL
jgi:hypothetical protein